jgi:cell wall-associated NlpC family hydrolase
MGVLIQHKAMRTKAVRHILPLLVLALFIAAGCTSRTGVYHRTPAKTVKVKEKAPQPMARKALPRLGYAIQAGAFTKVENAARLTETLQKGGLNATYFVAQKGLYKVQFGNFSSKEDAREHAELLQAVGVIDAYYIVSPSEYAVAKKEQYGNAYLRDELVKTAQSFIGVPYLWGGISQETGFDCSGLTMAVYQLNGLDLPRTSREQFEAGISIEQSLLSKGDLIFFSTVKGSKVSHVGIYAGEGRFIHSPRKGKKIRMDDLSSAYYRKRYVGGRSYL